MHTVTENLPSCGNATMHAAPWHAFRAGKEAGWLGAAITTALSSPTDTGSLGDFSGHKLIYGLIRRSVDSGFED